MFGDFAQRGGQGRLVEFGADRRGLAIHQKGCGVGSPEFLDLGGPIQRHPGRHDEAILGEMDGGLQHVFQAFAPMRGEQHFPRSDGPGNGDGVRRCLRQRIGVCEI